MPVIPVQGQTINQDVRSPESVNFAGAGASAEAISNTGRSISETAFSLANKAQIQEANDASHSQYLDDYIASEDYYNKLKMSSPDGNVYETGTDGSKSVKTNFDGTPRTISQEYRDWANDRYQQAQLSMPSALAQEKYSEQAGSFFTTNIGKSHTDELQLKIDASLQSNVDDVQKGSDSLVSIPSSQKAYEFSNNTSLKVQNQVATGVMPAEKAHDVIMKANAQYAESTLKGAVDQILAAKGDMMGRTRLANQWLSVIDGKDVDSKSRSSQGLGTISDMLTPDNKASLRAKFVEMGRAASDLDLSDHKAKFAQAENALETGLGSKVNVDQLKAETAMFVKSGKITPFEGSVENAKITASSEIGKIYDSSFFLASPSQRQAMLNQAIHNTAVAGGDGYAGSMAENEVLKKVGGYAAKINQKEQSDWGGYVAEAAPASKKAAQLDMSNPAGLYKSGSIVQDATRESKTIYVQHNGNLNGWTPLSQDQVGAISTTLLDKNQNEDMTLAHIRGLSAAYGKDFPAVMDQLINSGSLKQKGDKGTEESIGEEWKLIAAMPTSMMSTDVISAVKNKKAIHEQFLANLATNSTSEHKYNIQSSPTLAKFVMAKNMEDPNGQMNSSQIDAYTSLLNTDAQRRYNKDSTKPASELRQQADDLFINNNSYLVQTRTNGGSGNGIIALPKQIDGNPVSPDAANNLSDWVNDHNNQNSLRSVGIVPPPDRLGHPSAVADFFFPQAEKTGYWTKTRNGNGETGLTYFYQDRGPGGHYVQAHQLDPSGKAQPVFVPIDQALSYKRPRAVVPSGTVSNPIYDKSGNQING